LIGCDGCWKLIDLIRSGIHPKKNHKENWMIWMRYLKPIPTISTRWNLDDLLPNGTCQLDDIFRQIDRQVDFIESYRPKLSGTLSPEDFLELLHGYEALRELTACIAGFAYLSFAENTRNPDNLALQDRTNEILSSVDNRTMFFSLWYKALPVEIASLYEAAAGDLRYYLTSLRRYKPYTLSEAEEKVINIKDTNGCDALVKVYEIITNGFNFTLEVDGEVKKLNRDGLTHYYHHPSPLVRAAAYQELYRVYIENKPSLAQIYASLVRDWKNEGVDLRGYPSPISVRNVNNDIPDGVIDTLLAVCSINSSLFQRYFKLKANLLGMNRLRRYDIYAPITRSQKTIVIEEAIPLILESFEHFSPQLALAAYQVIDHAHLDTEVKAGKRGGAFSYSPGPKYIPWVLVNYNQHIRDVTTLAHELGHSVHAILASGHSILTFHAPLPLAETASVFAEMLVTDRLYQQEQDPLVRRDLLLTILDDAYATVERQAFISMFEREAHDKIANGGTSEELAALYLQNLKQQFGEAVELPEEFAWEWLTIPHIFTSPFYPYAYSLGQLLVLALYQQYQEDPEPFVPRYLRLLSHGGSLAPIDILTEAGIDITSPEFWQGGFDTLESKLDQLEKITGGSQ
jgi:oligoendopeptidase F